MYEFVGKESAFLVLAALALADGCKYNNLTHDPTKGARDSTRDTPTIMKTIASLLNCNQSALLHENSSSKLCLFFDSTPKQIALVIYITRTHSSTSCVIAKTFSAPLIGSRNLASLYKYT